MTTAQELPVPLHAPPVAPPLRLVSTAPELDFDVAVRRVQPRLHRYAVRRLGDVHEAEELVQEALLRAYSHRHQLLTEDDLAAWATVVTGRLVIDRLRVRGRSTPVADVPEGARVGRDTADVVVARVEARLALDALDAMPPRQAALLWAREVEGSSYDDLCTRFGMTEPAVRSVLTRARRALRKEYAARGGTMPVGGLALLAPWVVGLSWADRLRRTAAKVSTPAVLSALGISALGGLVLSPFGGTPPVSHPRFLPSPAVVAAGALPASAATLPGLVPAAVSRPGTGAAPTAAAPLRRALRRLRDGCVNDTSSDNHGSSVTYGGTSVGGVSAGSTTCNRARSVGGNGVYVNTALPDNPTGMRYVGVTSDYIACPPAPSTNALVACTTSPNPQQSGAPQ